MHYAASEQTAASHLQRMITFARERPACLRGLFEATHFETGCGVALALAGQFVPAAVTVVRIGGVHLFHSRDMYQSWLPFFPL